MSKQAELFDGTVLEFEDGTPDHVIERVARQETDRITTEQARKPLPAGVKPSEGRGGVGLGAADKPRTLADDPGPSRTLADIRSATRERDVRLGLAGKVALPDGVKPSQVEGGRGTVNPYNALVRRADQPFANKQEAVDEAVNLIESGVDRQKVYDEFEQASALGVRRSDIDSRGIELGGPMFTATRNAGAVRQGATEGAVTPQEPGTVEGVANFGKRVAARSSQTFTGVAANTGMFGAGGLASALARDEKRAQAAAPGTQVQQELEDLGKVKTYSEIPSALIQNPRGAAMMLFESLAMTAPMMAATVVGLPAKGMAAAVGAGSGGLEFGSVLTDALGDKNISVLDVQKVEDALNDPKFMAAVREKAATRGIAIGTVDALTAGFAGKFLAPALAAVRAGKLTGGAAVRATAGAWAKELGTQMAGGAGGELIGQKLTGENKPLDVAMEALGEAVGAPLEVRSNLAELKHAKAVAKYEAAAAQGFNVNPPYTTDPPDVQRKKTVGIFNAAVAQYGIDPEAAKRATEAANNMPAKMVGPFLARMAQALQKRKLVAKPVDEHALDTLTAGPIDDPKVLEAEAKAAETATKEAKTEPIAASRETTAEEDLTGLSEPSVIDKAATEGATHPSNDRPEPTQAQKEAENYKVGRDTETIPGERLSIENGAGSTRKGVSPEGKPWSTDMKDHYGRILGTVGMDSTPEKPQHVDFFAKAGTPAGHTGPVFIVDQVDPKTGAPDEAKVMFGYDSLEQARSAYLAHYEKGWKGLGAITETTLDDFKTWVHSDATSKPYGPAQPDVQQAPQAPAPGAAGGSAQPAGSGGTVGRSPASAGRESAAPAAAPVAGSPAAESVRDGAGGAPAAVGRVIARAGRMPNSAKPIELRPAGTDGKMLSAWHDGYELVDFDSGAPVQIPADATDAQAFEAVKASGAFGKSTKFFDGPKADAAAPTPPAAPITAPAAAPAPAAADPVPDELIRKATNAERMSPDKQKRAIASGGMAPAPEGFAIKYQPQGDQGAGFYYVQQAAKAPATGKGLDDVARVMDGELGAQGKTWRQVVDLVLAKSGAWLNGDVLQYPAATKGQTNGLSLPPDAVTYAATLTPQRGTPSAPITPPADSGVKEPESDTVRLLNMITDLRQQTLGRVVDDRKLTQLRKLEKEQADLQNEVDQPATQAAAIDALEAGKVLVHMRGTEFESRTWLAETEAGGKKTWVVKSKDADSRATVTKGPAGPDRQWGWDRGDAARKAAEEMHYPAVVDKPAESPVDKPAETQEQVPAKAELPIPAPAAPTPPVVPKVAQLSDSEAFSGDYAAFEGKTVEQTVSISDTGGTATLRIDAAKAMRALDARLKTLTELKGCIGRAA